MCQTVGTVADRNPSFFGPVLPVENDEPAFSFEELRRIRAMRAEADRARTGESAWPEERRFATIYPAPLRTERKVG